MGFFYNATRSQVKRAPSPSKHIPIATMQSMGCAACPRDKDSGLNSPKMLPDGPESAKIYILGEAPGENEDIEGRPFVGKSGKILKSQFDRGVLQHDVRIGNTIQCRPPQNRTPETTEIECCRRRVEQDIERAAPLVVIGTGNIPLNWATGFSSVMAWRGRPIVTRIGSHDCWYFPILHPSYVLRNQSKWGKSEVELVFERDLNWIQENLDKLTTPKVYDPPYDEGLTLIEGTGVSDFHALEDILNALAREPDVAIDLETSGLRPYVADPKIYLCSIATFDYGVSFPMDHPEAWNSTLRRKVWGLLAEFLLESRKKIAHHLGFELEWLTFFYGKRLAYITEWEDTLALAHTINAIPGTNSLDDLTRQYFGFRLKQQSRVNPSMLLGFPLKEGLRYNAMDSKWTHLLYHHPLRALVDRNRKYEAEYERKLRLEPSLVFMQQKGVPVDKKYAAQLGLDLVAEADSIEKQIRRCNEVVKYQSMFGTFNPGSPDHVLKLMRDVCKRDEVAKPDGGFTSDEGALSKIPGSQVPSAPLILEHRAVLKIVSTYIAPILDGKIVYPDGCIHSKFSSMIAITGRLASEDPNLQNFPKRKHKKVRGVIAAPPGYWITAADYGQIEARVIAMASCDDTLCRALWTGWDIHGYWADRFMKEYPRIKDRIIVEYNVDGDDTKLIRKKFRDEIKNGWVFPQFYGSHVSSCAVNLKVPEIVAEDLGREFWEDFKGVKKWQEKLIKGYEKNLYVETLTGRRRRGIISRNEIINTPVQGTASDIVTEAGAELSLLSVVEDDDELQYRINIHDDLTFFLADATLESKIERIAQVMCKPRFSFINVPLVIEVSVGDRWSTLEEVAVYKSNELFHLESPYA